MSDYVPMVDPERIDELRRWHEDTSKALHRLGAHDVDYLGLRLHVPEHVFPPTPTSDLLGREVLAHVPATVCSTWAAAPERTGSSPLV